jgi:hypothetical protein
MDVSQTVFALIYSFENAPSITPFASQIFGKQEILIRERDASR